MEPRQMGGKGYETKFRSARGACQMRSEPAEAAGGGVLDWSPAPGATDRRALCGRARAAGGGGGALLGCLSVIQPGALWVGILAYPVQPPSARPILPLSCRLGRCPIHPRPLSP